MVERAKLSVSIDIFPVKGTFTIARGSRTEVRVVVVSIERNGETGRGECVPYARYGEDAQSVLDEIRAVEDLVRSGISRTRLLNVMKPGAARNAVDCALWDIESRLEKCPVGVKLGLPSVQNLITAFTLSLDTPEKMAQAASVNRNRPLLKIKLGAPEGDIDRLRAIRSAAPGARLIVDANEGWTRQNLDQHITACVECGVELVEQPLPAGDDAALLDLRADILICADESLHTHADIPRLVDRYGAVNIKLDKAGGLTEAMEIKRSAIEHGMKVMVGCMLGSSLAMAPAVFLGQGADFVDLDGPLLLAQDRQDPLDYPDGMVAPPRPELWGYR